MSRRHPEPDRQFLRPTVVQFSRHVAGEELVPDDPEGVEVVSIAYRPELLRETYSLAQDEGYPDLAIDGEVVVTLDDWLHDEATLPGGSFVALENGRIVGYSGLMRHDNPGVAEDGLTEVLTWTQRGNEGMRAVNERLGYVYRTVSFKMMGPVPLA